ncbi:MAG: glucose-1-phosphate cytidylyltransferase [Nanoarchaeota archaeon]|mgnify:CR=1 FL=1
MKTVILCGGQGTRLREHTEFVPKPLVHVGNMPILWHIMKIYSHFGHKDFVLCLGYKGHEIKNFFMTYDLLKHDFTLNLANRDSTHFYHNNHLLEDWKITFVETGLETNTGGRIKQVEKYIDDDNFFMTYGDGLANININELYKFHLNHKKIATLTSIQPMSRFGIVTFDDKGIITSFKEKPKLDGWINGGFFVLKKDVFDYIGENDVFEQDPLIKLAKDKELMSYPHNGFWECMDTHRDYEMLNKIWNSGNAFWKVWK